MSTQDKLPGQADGQPTPHVIVEVVDDTPDQDKGKARAEPLKDAPPGTIPNDEELQQYSESVQKRFKRMSYEFHEQRRQREARERELEEAGTLLQRIYQENQRLKGTVSQGEQSLVAQAKGRVDAQIEAAREKFRKAHESGDTEALVKAQEEMADLQAQKQTVQNYRPQYQPPDPKEQAPQIRQQPKAPAVDPQAKAWADANPWFQTNKRMTAYAFGVHDELVTDKGLDPRSDPEKYYAELDKAMREQFPGETGGGEEEKIELPVVLQQPRKIQQAPSVVAPASRINVSKDGKRVQLTASQAAIAKRLGLSNEQYALEALKIARQDQ
jgi:hypothetical protein